jgi:hypothetical protein
MSDFEERVAVVLVQSGYKKRTSKELAEWWSGFVDQCVQGYDWTIYEYDDEIGVRDYIECVLNDMQLKGFHEYEWFRSAIDEVDKRFRAVLQESIQRPTDSPYWWRKGVLQFAGDEYRQDMESRYSILVDGY